MNKETIDILRALYHAKSDNHIHDALNELPTSYLQTIGDIIRYILANRAYYDKDELKYYG